MDCEHASYMANSQSFKAAQIVECLACFIARRRSRASPAFACRTDVDDVGPFATLVLERDVSGEYVDHPFLPTPAPTNNE